MLSLGIGKCEVMTQQQEVTRSPDGWRILLFSASHIRPRTTVQFWHRRSVHLQVAIYPFQPLIRYTHNFSQIRQGHA